MENTRDGGSSTDGNWENLVRGLTGGFCHTSTHKFAVFPPNQSLSLSLLFILLTPLPLSIMIIAYFMRNWIRRAMHSSSTHHEMGWVRWPLSAIKVIKSDALCPYTCDADHGLLQLLVQEGEQILLC